MRGINKIKRCMKKLAAAALALCLAAMAGMFVAPVAAEAAQSLELNRWYEVSMQNNVTTDYTFVMPSKGYLYAEVQPVSYVHNETKELCGYWSREYKITANNRLYEEVVDNESADGAGAYKTWTSKNYAFKKGTRVTLSVTADDSYDYYTGTFRIRIVSKAVKNFETENNNSKAKADALKVKKTYTGCLMTGDTDWFVFKAPKDGHYRVLVSLPDSQSYEMKATTYKGNKKLSENNIVNLSGWKKQFNGSLKKGEKVYVKISRQDFALYHKEQHLKYQIKVKSV